MKLMLLSALAMIFLVSCGGGSGSNSSPSTISNNGVAQKGPFSIDSKVTITKLDASGISTGTVIESKVTSKSGSFLFKTNEADINAYYRIQATGHYLDENAGSVSEKEIRLEAITKNPSDSSVNVLTHWQSQRTDALLAYDKTFKASLDQSQKELFKIFGIQNSNALDITTSSNQLDEENALLLLLSGALMEASQKYRVSSQIIIDEIGKDFADDGQLSEKGDDWFIRLQALIKNDPVKHTKKYAKTINDKLGYKVSLEENLPALIPLASRPVANLPSELLAEPSETITLDGSASHDSGDIINFTWFRVDQQTQYDVQVNDRFTATPTITVPDEDTVLAAPNQEISLLYALVVTDADKLTHTGVVKVTVKVPPPLNNPPIADSQTLITDEDTPIAITLAASDPDGDAINFVLSTPLATSNGLVELDSSLPNVVYTPTQDYFGADSFTFIVNDGFANSNTATIDIQVNPVNDPPIADAGLNQTVESLETVVLDGAASSDVDGTVDAYIWLQQSNGSVVTLSDDRNVSPTFTAPDVTSISETLTFDLVVTDNEGADSVINSVDILVNPANQPPVAIAGDDQAVGEGVLVTLAGSGTDIDGDVVEYLWVSRDLDIVLSDNSIPNPTFTTFTGLTAPSIKVFDLIVTDDDGAQSAIDSVNVTVSPPGNNRPIANAGPDQNVGFSSTNLGQGSIESTFPITLDGSTSSDVEDPTPNLTFNWSQVSGPITIDPDDLINPIIQFQATIPGGSTDPGVAGDYIFRLIVTDTEGLASAPAEVTINVRPNQPPIANDLSFPIETSGNIITLIGNDPDGDNANLVYDIRSLPATGRISVGGTEITAIGVITGNTVVYEANSISSPDPDNFTYRVIDQFVSDSNIATVSLTEPNTAPRAIAGFFSRSTVVLVTGGPSAPANFKETANITLDGSNSSDAEDANTDLSYQWSQISGPVAIPVGDIPQVMEPSFTLTNSNLGQTIVGEYVFQLVVTDTGGLVSDVDEISVFASLPNPDVIAYPGEDRDVIELTTVQVYGSGSSPFGIDNSLFAREWKQIDIIPGTEVTLVFDPSYERFSPTFIAPAVTVPTEVKLQLIVWDNEFGFSEPEVVIFTIYPTGTVLSNIKPTAVDLNISMNANGSGKLFELNGLGDDPDGDNLGLTYEIIGFNDPGQGLNDPNQGSIRAQTRNYVYTPLYTSTNPVVENSLTYIAIDQDGAESDPATVTFTPIVSPPGNAAPVAQDITINIDGPPTSSNSRQLLSYATMIQDAENDDYLINEISKNDLEVRFQLLTGNLRMDNRSRLTAGTGTFTYQAIDIFGNPSNIATITINYNN